MGKTMKLFTIAVLFICTTMFNQNLLAAPPDELPTENQYGGYLGPDIKITELNGEINSLIGIKGGLLIQETLLLGGAVYGSLDDVEGTDDILGYGGLYIDYFIGDPSDNRYSFNILIGAGRLDDPDDDDNEDAFLVIEPGISTQLYINQHTRLNIGLSYRLVRGSDYVTISDSDLSGVSIGLNLNFGKF